MNDWRADYAKARVRDAVDFRSPAWWSRSREGDRFAGLRVAITGTNSAPLVVLTEVSPAGRWRLRPRTPRPVQANANVLTTVAPAEIPTPHAAGAGAPAHRRMDARA